MRSPRIAVVAAVAAVTFWAVKAVAIGSAGGLGRSPAEGPLFLAGLVSFVVAVVSLGVALTRGARTWVRVAAGAGAFVVGLACSLVVDAVVASARGPEESAHWVWSEVNLWIVGLVVLVLAVTVSRRQAPAAVVRRPATAAGR